MVQGAIPGGSASHPARNDPESTEWAAYRDHLAPSSLRGGVVDTLGHVGKTRDAPETPSRPESPHPGTVEEARVGGAGDNRAALNPPRGLGPVRDQAAMQHGSNNIIDLALPGPRACPHIC